MFVCFGFVPIFTHHLKLIMYIEQALQHTKEKGRFRRVCYLAVSLFANDRAEEVMLRLQSKSTAIAF